MAKEKTNVATQEVSTADRFLYKGAGEIQLIDGKHKYLGMEVSEKLTGKSGSTFHKVKFAKAGDLMNLKVLTGNWEVAPGNYPVDGIMEVLGGTIMKLGAA